MKSRWQEEVAKFRMWDATLTEHLGEWECDYENWGEICQSVNEFLLESTPHLWKAEEIEDLLYILARDNESEYFSNQLLGQGSEAVILLALKSLENGDREARWQLADALGYLPEDERIEPILLHFANDQEEYVRRRALQSLARIGSTQTEVFALQAWDREDSNQQWARMTALLCWQCIGSPLLEMHLKEAEISPMLYLSDFARRLRNGEVELLR